MTRFSQAKGRKVVSLATAGTVGQVHDFVVDPDGSRVLAVHLKKTDRKADVLRWSDVHAFGADAVTVADAARVVETPADVDALSGKTHRVLGKRVLSVAGAELGEVSDVEFDDTTGVVHALVLGPDDTATACRLVGVGSYAVVVELTGPTADA